MNKLYRLGVGYPSEENLKAFSARLDILRANHINMSLLYAESNKYKEYTPTMKEDIDLIVDILQEKFGDTKPKLTSRTVKNPLSGAKMVKADVAWLSMLDNIPKLQVWVRNEVKNGKVYDAPVWDSDEEDNEADGDSGGDSDDDSDSPDDDFSDATIKWRTQRWCETHKPMAAETEAAYATRVAQTILDGKGGVRARARARAAAQDSSEKSKVPELIMTGAAARAFYGREIGREERKPNKILRHRTATDSFTSDSDDDDVPLSDQVTREYLCLWRDAGYADQDYEKWMPEDYVRSYPGFLESYLAVSCIA